MDMEISDVFVDHPRDPNNLDILAT